MTSGPVHYFQIVSIFCEDLHVVLDIGSDCVKEMDASHDSWATRLVFRRLDGPNEGPVDRSHVFGLFSQDGRCRLDIGSYCMKKEQPASHVSCTTRLYIEPWDKLNRRQTVNYGDVVHIISEDKRLCSDIGTGSLLMEQSADHNSWATRLKIRKIDQQLTLSEIKCERLESCQFGGNGGLIFKLANYPDIIVLMDDELIDRLKQYLNESFPTQSIAEARKILERAQCGNGYVLVRTYVLSGNKLEKDEEALSNLKGKYLLIRNGKLVPRLFDNLKDMMTSEMDKNVSFCIGYQPSYFPTQSYLRSTSTKRDCGMMVKKQFYDGHYYLSVTIAHGLQSKQKLYQTRKYLVDSGADESSFPGWYSSVDNLVRSLDDSNVISGFQFIDHTGAMTGNGGKDTVRLFDNFTVQIEGLEPIEVDCMCADKLSSQRKDTTLLLTGEMSYLNCKVLVGFQLAMAMSNYH